MHIICPHCTTSYAIDLATLGVAGRTVRCSRCKEVWLARPEDAIEVGAPVAGDGGSRRAGRREAAAAQWDAQAAGERRPGAGNPGRRQPLDIERLAGFGRRRLRRRPPAPTGRRQPGTIGGRGEPRGSPRRRHGSGNLLKPPALLRASRQIIRQPSDRLRRHGRAGAGADDLARRGGAAAAANRDVLQNGRSRRQSARADVQGRQDHHRNRGRQTGAGDRGRDRRRGTPAGRVAAAALQRHATRMAPRSTPGTRCWTSRC